MSEEATATWISDGVVADVRRGLTDDPKWLSSLYFYDEVGSQLFEDICATPEYYPTRTEHAILTANSDAILDAAGGSDDAALLLAELGSGSSVKTRTILAALMRRQSEPHYLPVDISADFLATCAADLEGRFPGLHVDPIAAEYHEGLRRIGARDPPPGGRRLVLFLGSSIGNFEPAEQAELLQTAHDALAPGDAFLLGMDLAKEPAILEAAYDDAAGVTAAFNKNIIAHLNARLDASNDPEAFEHVALWNAEASRVEMHLRSRIDQTLSFPRADLEVRLAAGELIHTENSYKFTDERMQELVDATGWSWEQTWNDDQGWFAVALLRRT